MQATEQRNKYKEPATMKEEASEGGASEGGASKGGASKAGGEEPFLKSTEQLDERWKNQANDGTTNRTTKQLSEGQKAYRKHRRTIGTTEGLLDPFYHVFEDGLRFEKRPTMKMTEEL